MKRSEEPRVGAFASCPFCGERKRLTLVTKRMRRGDGEWPTASYVRCLNCNARGPRVGHGDKFYVVPYKESEVPSF